MWGPAIVMIHVVRPFVCVSHANISEIKWVRSMVTIQCKQKLWLSDSEPVIRFAIGSMVLSIWVFWVWHFAHLDRNGALCLVNGSVETVTSLYTRPALPVSLCILCASSYAQLHWKKRTREQVRHRPKSSRASYCSVPSGLIPCFHSFV